MNNLIYKNLLKTFGQHAKKAFVKRIEKTLKKDIRFIQSTNIAFDKENSFLYYNKQEKNLYRNLLKEQMMLLYSKNSSFTNESTTDQSNDDINNEIISILKEYNKEEKHKEWLKCLTLPLGMFVMSFFADELNCEEENKEKVENDIPHYKNVELMKSLKKPYLGCSIRQKDNEGMQIVMVKSGSPADNAGLNIKDVIIEIDGKPINSINEYNMAIGKETGKKKIKYKKFMNNVKSLDGGIQRESEKFEIIETLVIFE